LTASAASVLRGPCAKATKVFTDTKKAAKNVSNEYNFFSIDWGSYVWGNYRK
jgi:hypothetical protein